MANKYEIGSPISSPHLNTLNSEALLVVSRKDLLKLESEIKIWEKATYTHPEVFFLFENYPTIIAFPNVEKAKRFLENGNTWYGNFPEGKRFWVEVKSIKS